MATIQQSMSLYDGVTGPLRQMQQAMALTLNTFESMQNSISENVAIDFGTQELESGKAVKNNATVFGMNAKNGAKAFDRRLRD